MTGEKLSRMQIDSALALFCLNAVPATARDVRVAWTKVIQAYHPDTTPTGNTDFDANIYAKARDVLLRAIEERDSE